MLRLGLRFRVLPLPMPDEIFFLLVAQEATLQIRDIQES
jgi:hypothetical protein